MALQEKAMGSKTHRTRYRQTSRNGTRVTIRPLAWTPDTWGGLPALERFHAVVKIGTHRRRRQRPGMARIRVPRSGQSGHDFDADNDLDAPANRKSKKSARKNFLVFLSSASTSPARANFPGVDCSSVPFTTKLQTIANRTRFLE
jgi:hypothetical protein